MRFYVFLVLTLHALQLSAQPDPFKMTFINVFIGPNPYEIHRYDGTMSVDWDGDRLNATIVTQARQDFISFKLSRTGRMLVGDDWVQYEFVDPDKFYVYIRYCRYGVNSPLDVCFVHPDGQQIIFTKRNVQR